MWFICLLVLLALPPVACFWTSSHANFGPITFTTFRFAHLPNSEEHQAAVYTLKNYDSISIDALAKGYRSNCPTNGKKETLKNGDVVPSLVCTKGTAIHSITFAYHVLKSKTRPGTSGMGATTMGLHGPDAIERARLQADHDAYGRATNVYGAPPDGKKDAVMALVKKVRWIS